jgi:hypothetical protein
MRTLDRRPPYLHRIVPMNMSAYSEQDNAARTFARAAYMRTRDRLAAYSGHDNTGRTNI